MATFVEYLDQSDLKNRPSGGKRTPIGYLATDPEPSLRNLLPNFHVVNYLGVVIPSRSMYANHNQGLKISPVVSGIGLVGTVEMLNQSDLFQSCRHEPFPSDQREDIVKKIKSILNPMNLREKPLAYSVAENYALIFDLLGFPMSADALVEFSTQEKYYDPSHN